MQRNMSAPATAPQGRTRPGPGADPVSRGPEGAAP
jgi:hypothetical protein